MKFRSAFFLILISIASFLYSAEVIKRNISWTLEGKNDPIIQVTNDSEENRTLRLRIMIGDSSYRLPVNLDIPSGENRFIRVREQIDKISDRYPELKSQSSGLLQIEFDGADRDIKTRTVNLNPKGGISAERESERKQSPTIESIDPKSGNPSGGTVVTIQGKNFDESTIVKFGGVAALRTRQSPEVLIAVAPQHAVGTVDIEVANGKLSAKKEKVFRYDWDSPQIGVLQPDSGSSKGGTKVDIQGHNFQNGVVVKWDSVPLTARFQTPELISVVTPPGKSGPIAVEVINPDGKSVALQGAYTYKGLPSISSVSPQMGATAGGYTLTISGSNFEPGTSVLLGSRYVQTVFINPNAVAAVVPSGDSGFTDVTVSNSDGEMVTSQQAFLYNDPPKIQEVVAYPNPIVRLTSSAIAVKASDPELGPMQYEFRLIPGPAGGAVIPNGDQATYNSANVLGTAIIQVIVTDQYGAKAQSSVEITVE
jgi:IPT/TIG domain